AGMSTSTQCEKSARGSDAGTVRPSLLTSSGLVGASPSTHSSTNDRVAAGAPDHDTRGLRFGPITALPPGAGTQNANCFGIGAPGSMPSTSIDSAMGPPVSRGLSRGRRAHYPLVRVGSVGAHPADRRWSAGGTLADTVDAGPRRRTMIQQVQFTRMEDGTPEELSLIVREAQAYKQAHLVDNVLGMLR